MTLKTFTTTLLLATSFLFFTACDSKTNTNAADEQNPTAQVDTPTGDTGDGIGTDEGANSAGEGGSTSTGGIDDDNTTSGVGNDDNTTTTPTITLTSLTLTIDKTSLNKDENTTVKVMATYSDNTSKEVTDKVAWVVTPSDAAKVTNATLTAVQDKTTTVKAKLNTTLSNIENLNITWTVNGHTLPPEPDKVVNDSTLLGVDVNDNGVRDDVERWIYEEYKDKHPIHIDIAMQAGRASKKILEIPLNDIAHAKIVHELEVAAVACEAYYKIYAKYFNEPLLVTEEISVGYFEKFYFDTLERVEAYNKYAEMLSGDTYSTPKVGVGKNLCDFNTIKYEE